MQIHYVPEILKEKEEERLRKVVASPSEPDSESTHRIVTSYESMREKAMIFNEGFDDRWIEILKVEGYSQLIKKEPGIQFEAIFFTVKDGKYYLVFSGKRSFITELTKEHDEEMWDDIFVRLNETPDDEFVIDFKWAAERLRKEGIDVPFDSFK